MNTQVTTTTEKPCSVKNVQGLFDTYALDIKAILPQGLIYERLLRIALTTLAKVPKLKECTQASFIGAILQSVMTGLEPDGTQACIIPYKNQAQFQPMYQGLMKLCRNADITRIYAEIVRENDEFSMTLGTNKKIVHIPNYKGDRGTEIGYYAVYYNKEGEPDFEYMTRAEIDYTRAQSSRAKSDSPWNAWYDEMAKKTVLKRLLKRAPKSIEVQSLLDIDNTLDSKKGLKPRDIFEAIDLQPPADVDEQDPQEIPAPQPLGEESQVPPEPQPPSNVETTEYSTKEKSVEAQVLKDLE